MKLTEVQKASYCEYGNEPPVFIKDKDILHI